MSEISTKPYFMRAIYEWCSDNGYTPYLAVKVNVATKVPMEFVRNGEIVLNISFGATSGLKMDNEAVSFKARFGGVSRDLYIPVANVMAIYASENGQGMAFEVELDAADTADEETQSVSPTTKPGLGLAASSETLAEAEKSPSEKKSEKPSLKIVK